MTDEKINPNCIAKEISRSHVLIYSAGQFHRYEKGVYRPVSDHFIKSQIKQRLGKLSSIRMIGEVFHALSLDTYLDAELLNPKGKEYINLLGGMLNTLKLEPVLHDPKYLSTVQLNGNFCLTAKCPLFIKTVKEWLDSTDKVELLQEFLGYCLTGDATQEKILFLIGSGANGKSTLLHVIEALFGSTNCSAIPLDKLANRFDLAQLYGKALNVASETPSKSVLCDDIIKAVVSGDLVQGERKFKEPFFFKPHAKFIVACNEIPRTDDKTNALYRRLLILRFNRSYSEDEQDRTLKDKLISEKDGILNWALEGLKRLRERKYFNEPQESIAERESYRKENNTLLTFAEECCELCDLGETAKNVFYEKYKNWCDESGLKPLSKPRLGKSLKEQFKVGEDTTGSDDQRHRVWTGIVFK